MKKKYIIACLLLLGAILLTENSFAGIAYPYPVQINQADGTVITVILNGDEDLSWAKTTDDFTLLYNDEGIYEYAIQSSSGDLITSGRKAHDITERTPSEIAFLSTIQKNMFFSSSQVSYLEQINDMQRSIESTKAFPTTGNRKLLCILIGFSDLAFTETNANFDDLFNQVGYGTYGSVKDYYEENSYGQFHLTVDVAGPYQASNTHHYYGQNSGTTKDINVKELITEAVFFAAADVDYSDYDNDGDGNVDGIYVIYASYNEGESGGADCIWYHASAITPVPMNGVNVSSYSCSAEYKGNTGSDITGIGNICHEFGHVMGAPDFYDTDYEIGGQYSGCGGWCVMSSGNFNGDRDCPAHYNPYIKYFYFGWITPIELTSQGEMTLLNSTENSDQLYFYKTPTTGEYFWIENQQQIGFDAEVPGHGLIVYHSHVDLQVHGMSNKTHPQRFYPVCADAGTEPSATAADYGEISSMDTPFPGAGSNIEFTDATLPSSKSWAGADTKKDLAFISENTGDNTITLCFMGCPPVADFIANVFDPCVGDLVMFDNLSEYATSCTWSFSPTTISYVLGSTSTSYNPIVKFNEGGNYTVKLTAKNDYGSDIETKTNYIYVHTAPVVTTQPLDVAAEWGDNVSFTAAASGDPTPTVYWKRSIDGGDTFHDLVGETSTTVDIPCVTLEMSGYQYEAIFTNKCGDDWTNIATLTVTQKTVTAAITVVPNPQQYSDEVDINIAIANGFTCGEYAATGADIYIGTQFMGTVAFTVSGSDLTASLNDVALLEPTPFGTEPTGQMAPGNHTVTAVLSGVNSNFTISNPGTTLSIACEDADVTYNGGEFFTANPNNGDFTAALSAFVVDAIDPSRGEIRNADVTFREENEFGTVLGIANIPVGLIDFTNFQEGFVTTDINGTLNNHEQSSGGRIYEVWAGADNYYCGEIETPVMVSITMPGGEYVTGGGHIIMTNTTGLYPGLNNAGKRMNFGLVMKWNKSGKNLQGKVNVIYRGADGYNYKIKSNAINSLSVETVEEGDLTFNKATISTKANLRKLMPGGVISLGGNLSLIVTTWECVSVNTGEFDRIGVQLAGNGGSGIWFTSNWAGGNTIAQTLDGGKIQVGMNNNKSGEITEPELTSNSQVFVYPNPTSGPVTFEFQLEEDSKATLDVYSTSGRMVSRIFEGEVESGELRTIQYKEVLSAGVYYYILRTDNLVKTGKFIRTLK